MKLFKDMGGGERSCSTLVAQIRAFINFKKPYDFKYVYGTDDVFRW